MIDNVASFAFWKLSVCVIVRNTFGYDYFISLRSQLFVFRKIADAYA